MFPTHLSRCRHDSKNTRIAHRSHKDKGFGNYQHITQESVERSIELLASGQLLFMI